ncbi:YeiH family protein [Acidicapsa ligni]|uniref:YeiH family protein n=1 Tax=Acidicapsa ligni TaxID=542300 RepID=UPI0021DF4380|nr:YeiH family protein [Acidicapsa ligni]
MKTNAATIESKTQGPLVRAIGLIPGILLLAVIGYAAKLIEQSINGYTKTHHIVFPNIEYVLWAIVIGLLIGNLVKLPAIFSAGVDTYEFWLKAGIVLLGSRFLVADIRKLGGISLLLVFVEIGGALLLMTALGKAFGLRPKLIHLLAIGSAVCGVSAIIAAKGAIDADDEDSSFAIAAILALGAISLVAFPLVGSALHLSDHAYGIWTGLAVDNTAEATAAGALFSDSAGKVAILTKTCRNALIGFVVLGYAIYWARKGQAGSVGNKAAFLWQKFPKFVLGFLLISLVVSMGVFDAGQIKSLANLSRWAFLLTFAGVGLKTNFRELSRQGFKPFAVGVLGEVLIAVLTLGLVIGTNRIWTL